jgi:adenosylcobinamide-GDP ribazoletransferase
MTAPHADPEDTPRSRSGFFGGLTIATAFLTRIPLAADIDRPLAAGAWAFPLVGAGIGALATIGFLVAQGLGLGAPVASLLAVLTSVVLTGAFHEDGLADTIDGFGGGRTREGKLAIMRDSRHGTFGIVAIMFSIALRSAALATIGDPIHAGLALVAAHSLSRGALPGLMRLLSPARPDGLGATAGRPGLPSTIAAALTGAVVALGLLGPAAGAVGILITGAALASAARLAQRQIGGYTGDVLGFFQQIGEILMLLVAAAAR